MGKYNWGINTLIAKRDEYKSKLNDKKIMNAGVREWYQELCDMYDELIENYDVHLYKNNDSEPNDNENSYNLKYLNEEIFNQISTEKFILVGNAVDISKKYKTSFQEHNFETLPIKDSELVERTRILFEQLPGKEFLARFDKFTNPHNCLFHIKHCSKLGTQYKGLAYTDTKTHTPYGLVARDNTIQDIITTAHEIFHMIIRQYEHPFFSSSPKTVYTEVEGFFANILFSDLLKQYDDYNQSDLRYCDKRDLLANIDIAKNAFIIKNGFDYMNKDYQIDFNKLKMVLQSKNIHTPITENNFPFFIDENQTEGDLDYAMSYLAALDLYYQYKNDPEKALCNLLNVPMLQGKSIEHDLEKINVSFFEDGYKNLNKQCKILLKRNTTSSKK